MSATVDWHPEIVFWTETNQPYPLVDWPKDWEVCGYPQLDSLHHGRAATPREGHLCLAIPRYPVADVAAELENICAFLDRTPEREKEKWLALDDRHVTVSCASKQIEESKMKTEGFHIPGPVLARAFARSTNSWKSIGFHSKPRRNAGPPNFVPNMKNGCKA